MKYTDSEVSPAFQQYFGKRYDKWKTTLDGILDEKRLSDEEVTDQNQKKFKSSITFSWLGLLFNILWYAYHGGKNWLAFTFVMAAYSVFLGASPLILGFEIWLSTQWVFLLISFIPAVLLAMFAKPYILATKFDEVSRTGGSIQPASWGRVFGALAILVVATMVSQALIVSFLFQQF